MYDGKDAFQSVEQLWNQSHQKDRAAILKSHINLIIEY